MLEPLLEGFNEPGVTGDDAIPFVENTSIKDGDRETQAGEPSGDPVSPQGDPVSPQDDPVSPQGSSGKGVSNQADGEEDWVSAESGSIGDDIAALEEELREEEGLLLDGDTGDGEEGVRSGDRFDGTEDAVQKAAWCLFEVLLPRCVGLEGQGLETRLEEPTRFSHRFVILYEAQQCLLLFFCALPGEFALVSCLRLACSIAGDITRCVHHYSQQDQYIQRRIDERIYLLQRCVTGPHRNGD